MARTANANANGHADAQPQAPAAPTVGYLAGQLAGRIRAEAHALYQRRTPAAWFAIALGVLAACVLLGRQFARPQLPPPPAFYGTTPAYMPAPAAPQTVTFVVQSAANVKGRLLLNDNADYKLAGVTVVGQGPAFANVNVDAFKGRTVTATGLAGSYRGRPEVIVNDPSQILLK
jgi:hypothetical protein